MRADLGLLGVVQGETLWAHHPLLFAIPAFVPAVAVVGVVLYIARKDRQDERRENELIDRAFDTGDAVDTPDDGDGRSTP